MTIERASEIVAAHGLNNDTSIDLFCHFVDYFKLEGDSIRDFAIMCGYRVATMVRIIR